MKIPTRSGSRAIPIFATVLLAMAAAVVIAGTRDGEDPPGTPPAVPATTQESPTLDPQGEDIQVPPPPFSEGIFPCTQCHDGETVPVNTTRRKLVDAHDDIVLKHGPNRWCLDCHSAEHRDKLHLVDGTLIDFSKLYLLCGQCHGDKLRDWRVGVHGKRTGMWNGQKHYLLCVNCHNPHSPHFPPLKPLPPPIPPSRIQIDKGDQP